MAREVLNIPTHYLNEVKDNKQLFELFAVAVLFKMLFPNSIVGVLTNETLRKLIHCKHNVAERILDGMKDCPYFIVNQKTGVVFVPSFKSNEIKTFGRHKKQYRSTSDYCKKLEIKDYTLREIKRALRELPLQKVIHTVQTKQVRRLGKAQSHFNDCCATGAKNGAITLKQLSASFGLSKSSAWRYIDRMVNDGRVSKTPIVAECVIPELNDVTARAWMERHPNRRFYAWHNIRSGGWTGWVGYGCIYAITDRRVSESFKHVIWNHKTRLSGIVAKSGDTPDGEAYWGKHC